MRLRGGLLPALLLLTVAPALAHEVRPGYLELTQRDESSWSVLFKVPMRGDMRLRLLPRFPETCRQSGEVSSYVVPGAMVERWTIDCPEGLVGGLVGVDGLEATLTDVLIRIEPLGASSQTARLDPTAPTLIVPAAPSRVQIARTYLVLGVEHILGGIDHLLFVLALLMIVKGRRKLVWTVTSFTVAHSITLALAVLGFVTMPPAPVEAVIALSILFLATEIVHSHQGRPGLTEEAPWIVAFSFGLLHGFGFAGALSEVGLPDSDIPLALLLFNVGVEIGQLLFVAGALAVMWLGRRLSVPWPQWAWRVPTYAIGSVAAYWTIERVAGFWT